MYKISISARCQYEIEEAIEFYCLHSQIAPLNFIKTLENTYSNLSKNPSHQIRYKNIRSISLKKFPFSLYYTVNEKGKTIKILACFHNKKNPNKRPT